MEEEEATPAAAPAAATTATEAKQVLATDLQRYRVPARVQRVVKHQIYLCAADGSSCTDQADSLAALLRSPCVWQHAKEGGAAA